MHLIKRGFQGYGTCLDWLIGVFDTSQVHTGANVFRKTEAFRSEDLCQLCNVLEWAQSGAAGDMTGGSEPVLGAGGSIGVFNIAPLRYKGFDAVIGGRKM